MHKCKIKLAFFVVPVPTIILPLSTHEDHFLLYPVKLVIKQYFNGEKKIKKTLQG